MAEELDWGYWLHALAAWSSNDAKVIRALAPQWGPLADKLDEVHNMAELASLQAQANRSARPAES